MTARGAVLGVGRLLSLEVLNPKTGRSRTQAIRGKWLAWSPTKRTYCICTVQRGVAGLQGISAAIGTGQVKLPAAVLKAHRRFHRAPPRSVTAVDVPNPKGALRQVGLLRALVYDVPHSVRSPGKNRYRWHHAFGDTGHQGGSAYPLRVLPALMKDRAGNLFIKRRPGNIFTVDTWLRG